MEQGIDNDSTVNINNQSTLHAHFIKQTISIKNINIHTKGR